MPWRTRTIFTHVHLQRRALTHEAHTHRVPALPLATETVYGIGENDMNVERRTRPMPERTQPTIYFRVQRLLERCVIFPGGILFNANFAIFPEPDFFLSLSLVSVCASVWEKLPFAMQQSPRRHRMANGRTNPLCFTQLFCVSWQQKPSLAALGCSVWSCQNVHERRNNK